MNTLKNIVFSVFTIVPSHLLHAIVEAAKMKQMAMIYSQVFVFILNSSNCDRRKNVFLIDCQLNGDKNGWNAHMAKKQC